MKPIIIMTILYLLLSGCVQTPVFKDENTALIKSNYPIVAINGIAIDKTYKLDLDAGENSLLVVYNTYQYDYFCSFKWIVKAGTAYEITDQDNQYPLTLFHWERRNSVWSTWLDPVDPTACTRKIR